MAGKDETIAAAEWRRYLDLKAAVRAAVDAELAGLRQRVRVLDERAAASAATFDERVRRAWERAGAEARDAIRGGTIRPPWLRPGPGSTGPAPREAAAKAVTPETCRKPPREWRWPSWASCAVGWAIVTGIDGAIAWAYPADRDVWLLLLCGAMAGFSGVFLAAMLDRMARGTDRP